MKAGLSVLGWIGETKKQTDRQTDWTMKAELSVLGWIGETKKQTDRQTGR